MTKKELLNEVYAGIDDLETAKAEIASLETPNLNYEEFIETVEKQGFDFLLNDSTITVSDAIMSHIEFLEAAMEKAVSIMTLIINSSVEQDTAEQIEAKKNILKKYNAYMDSLS